MNPQVNGQDWQLTTKNIQERNLFMFNNPFMSDVSFTCGDVESKQKVFYAHKYVLATSSPVLFAMCCRDKAADKSLVHLSDTDEEALGEFLRFLYTDECKMTPKLAGKLLYLAMKFNVPFLGSECAKCLMIHVGPQNVCALLEVSMRFDLKQLHQRCWDIIDSKTRKVIMSDAFYNTKQSLLGDILKREKLNVLEVELFQAVDKWSAHQCAVNGIEPTGENRKSCLGDVLYKVRYLLMSQLQFARYVSMSGLLTDDEIVAIYDKFSGLDITPTNSLRQCLSKPQRRPKKCLLLRPARFKSVLSNGKGSSSMATHRLCFSVDKAVILHGVSLFGDRNWSGSEYRVNLEVEGVKMNAVYKGKCGGFLAKMMNIANTFDVLFTRAVKIDEGKVVELCAVVEGPRTFLGSNGEEVVEVEGIKVRFSTSPLAQPTSITDINQGQFYQLIISSMD